jgi:DNA (cytosine-5)-methyltransferase 1
MGYHRAGFEVVGVDIKPQPHYPFEFHRDDALTFDYEGFDVIHASPPCQEVSSTRHLRDAQGKQGRTLNLIPETRDRLRRSGLVYVIENVPRAPLLDPVWLCGSMFGLSVPRGPLRRHRGFESNAPLVALPDLHRFQGRPLGVYGSMRDDIPHGGRTVESLAEGRALMGIDWMKWDELKEAIPPAYTAWIGQLLIAGLATRAAA